jgi:hypothetical protein
VNCCCWNCNTEYPDGVPKCPACDCTNPNVDLDGAYRELQAQFPNTKWESIPKTEKESKNG